MQIVIVDDHPAVRAGVQVILRQLAPDSDIHEFSTLNAALALLAQRPAGIDLLVMDLGLPDVAGLGGLAKVRDSYPLVPVVVVSAIESVEVMHEALALGALGYVPKTASGDTLRAALTMVLDGQTYVPPDVIAARSHARGEGPGQELSAREREVLNLLAVGKTNQQIAAGLGISENTVRVHVSAILRRLGVTNRTEAAVQARRIGFPVRT